MCIFSKLGKWLWDELDVPYNWNIYERTIEHIPSKVRFWIGNSSFFFNYYSRWDTTTGGFVYNDNDLSYLGLIERHLIYRKVKLLIQLKYEVDREIIISQLIGNEKVDQFLPLSQDEIKHIMSKHDLNEVDPRFYYAADEIQRAVIRKL